MLLEPIHGKFQLLKRCQGMFCEEEMLELKPKG